MLFSAYSALTCPTANSVASLTFHLRGGGGGGLDSSHAMSCVQCTCPCSAWLSECAAHEWACACIWGMPLENVMCAMGSVYIIRNKHHYLIHTSAPLQTGATWHPPPGVASPSSVLPGSWFPPIPPLECAVWQGEKCWWGITMPSRQSCPSLHYKHSSADACAYRPQWHTPAGRHRRCGCCTSCYPLHRPQ